MKAHITRDGRLIVSPENDLEAFALSAWHAGWCMNCQINPTSFELSMQQEAAPDSASSGGKGG